MWHNLERVQMKLDKQIKRHSNNGWHTQKGILRNSTRFDLKTKNNTTETKCCGPECVTFTDLCWADSLIFASENWYSNESRS